MRSALAALTLVVALLVVGVAGAAAHTTPVAPKRVIVTGGQVTFTPSAKTLEFLKSQHITVTTLGKAKLDSGSLVLPVLGGIAGERRMNGIVALAGGVRFTKGTTVITVRHLTLERLGKRAVLAGLVNGHPADLARLSSAAPTTQSNQATASGKVLLTAAAARRISRVFGHTVAAAGYELGTFTAVLTITQR